MRRGREEDEALELYAALLRQSGTRAVERVRQRRTTMVPIDALVICYTMHYLDTSAFPQTSYMAQAQAVVTGAIERVGQPQHFAFVPLPALVETLVAEHTAEAMQQTVSSLTDFIDAREALGRWIDDRCEAEMADEMECDEDAPKDDAVSRVAGVWRGAQFWVAVHDYVEALSRSSAHVHAVSLRPRYEMELMQRLTSIGCAGKGAQEAARLGRLTSLLADLTALSNCRGVEGVRPAFFAMAHARLSVLAACERLGRFAATARVAPPPLSAPLEALQAQRAAIQGAAPQRTGEWREEIGLPLDFVASEVYMRSVLEKQQDTLGEDEELFRDEIVDYYKNHPQPRVAPQREPERRRDKKDKERERVALEQPGALVKPHRFCKVKTGYTWTQYNRTHYDIRTNPPPRSVLWYEFTLFYPALADTKRDMSRIYHIEDTPKGRNDNYCILVFSVGPPYADVAYQIVRKQWDPRPGGVRASFDSSGTYRLFFRFTNSNYRR